MNSNLLESVGLGNMDIAYLLIGMLAINLLLFILIIIQIIKTNKLKNRFAKFMQGKDAKSLEKNIIGLFEDNKLLKISAEGNRKELTKINRKMEYGFQKVGIVKYNAFTTMGGLLSFSLALLNDHDDGFIINSVHSSEACYLYTKEIKNGESNIALGDEEQEALEKALKSNNKERKKNTNETL